MDKKISNAAIDRYKKAGAKILGEKTDDKEAGYAQVAAEALAKANRAEALSQEAIEMITRHTLLMADLIEKMPSQDDGLPMVTGFEFTERNEAGFAKRVTLIRDSRVLN